VALAQWHIARALCLNRAHSARASAAAARLPASWFVDVVVTDVFEFLFSRTSHIRIRMGNFYITCVLIFALVVAAFVAGKACC